MPRSGRGRQWCERIGGGARGVAALHRRGAYGGGGGEPVDAAPVHAHAGARTLSTPQPMSLIAHDYLVDADAPIEDAVAPVVHRVATGFQHVAARYDGVRIHRGCVVFGGTIDDRLVTLQLGVAANERLGLRVLVNGVAGARAAVIAFPTVLFVCLVVGAQVGEAFGGLLVALVGGIPLAAGAAYLAYRLALRGWWGGGRDAVGADRVAVELVRALRETLEPIAIPLVRGDVELAGIDAPPPNTATIAVLERAVRSIAERRRN